MSHVLAFIGAKGHSTRCPGKNTALVIGRTLLDRAIASARDCARVVVSTDDAAIAGHVTAWGDVVVNRVPAIGPVSDLMGELRGYLDTLATKPDVIVLLNPTSPLRTATHVREALALLETSGADTVVSVTLGHESAFSGGVLGDGTWLPHPSRSSGPRPRTQDLGAIGYENGAIFAATWAHWQRTSSLFGGRTAAYVMPRHASVDVDTPDDLRIARALAAEFER